MAKRVKNWKENHKIKEGTLYVVDIIVRLYPTSKIWGKRTRKIETELYQKDEIPINENQELRNKVRKKFGITTDSFEISKLIVRKIPQPHNQPWLEPKNLEIT